MMTDIEQRLREAQGEYLDFLDDEESHGIYHGLVKEMISEGGKRLIVNLNDLRRKNLVRAQALSNRANEEILAFSRALKDFTVSLQPDYAKKATEFYVGFEGCFGDRHLSPRTLNSQFIGNLVCVEGIVTKVSLIRPKIVQSVHFCSATKKVLEKKYSDLMSLEGVPTNSAYPTKDDDGNLLETEFGLSIYKDHQTVTIQEMPENSPAGQLPRSVDVICDDDLVDQCKPGDRVQVVASYRCMPSKHGGYTSGTFNTILIANNISQLNKQTNLSITREEVAACKKLAKSGDIYDLLSKSLAPSIHGHGFVKNAILCLLLGGVEKNLINGTRLRGDINILLIGDPSVAKSQLLRYVLLTAPRAIPTTGRGSSGVGLTAAVTTDQETGERRLEAGAMVLADRGVVCIDEFDKMSDIDRTAIHEVMEQGRVTISKAGVHATLNARCSVLAAANPVYGRYDQYKTPMENIGLQDSLLSRFDLLFVMLDTIEKEQDKIIANHVVRTHRYRDPREQDGELSAVETNTSVGLLAKNDENDTNTYENSDVPARGKLRGVAKKVLSAQFMRKYIHIAKCLRPKLTEPACEVISNEYSKLRSQEMMESDVARTQPITVRTLETLIRLATAHAKARLSNAVQVQDAKKAIELVEYAYFKKVLEKESKKRHRNDDDDDASNDENESDNHSTVADSHSESAISRKTPKRPRVIEDLSDTEENILESVVDTGDLTFRDTRRPTATAAGTEQPSSAPEPITLSEARLTEFRTLLNRCFQESHEQSLSLDRIANFVNANNANVFSKSEIEAAIIAMTDENQIMLADEMVFII